MNGIASIPLQAVRVQVQTSATDSRSRYLERKVFHYTCKEMVRFSVENYLCLNSAISISKDVMVRVKLTA